MKSLTTWFLLAASVAGLALSSQKRAFAGLHLPKFKSIRKLASFGGAKRKANGSRGRKKQASNGRGKHSLRSKSKHLH